MPDFSRRVFLAGTAGLVAGDLSAQTRMADPGNPMSEIAGTMPPLDEINILAVDAFGAVGDCAASGSTAGSTDDSAAIAEALEACPDGGIVRFSPGKSYAVSHPIHVTGKQINIDARGAVIRCRDDSVWHVFTIGGTSDAFVEEINVWGGLWDGNLENQRYYPNTNGKMIFTDRGTERYGQHVGAPFYENSKINGTAWDNGWIDGQSADGIDVSGGGNDGLIRIQFAERANFHACTAKDWVRNAFVTWCCPQNLFFNMQGSGQLPTHFHELKALFDLQHEAAFLKTGGDNPEALAMRGRFFESVKVMGGRCDGGVMPIFCRTNRPKPEAAANHVVIDGFEAYGFSRDVWFEVATSIRISKSQIVGASAPSSAHRQFPGIFIGNGTVDWSISDSYIRGHIDTRQKQNVRLGTLHNVTLECDSAIPEWLVACNKISNSIIRSRGFGVFCEDALNVEVYAEAGQSLVVSGSARNCRIGRERREGRIVRFNLSAGQNDIEIGKMGGLDFIRRGNPVIQGGRWYNIHPSRYTLADGKILFDQTAQVGDIIEIGYYDLMEEVVSADPGQTVFRLSQPGGTRASDILSVMVNEDVVPPAGTVSDPALDVHYTVRARPDGHCDVRLANLKTAASDRFKISYLPPLHPYAGLMLKSAPDGYVRADVIGRNMRDIRISGAATISGHFSDLAGDAALTIDQDAQAELLDLTVIRARGGILAASGTNRRPDTVRMVNCLFQDWGLDGDATGDGRNLRGIGQNAKNGLEIQNMVQMQGTIWMRSGQEPTASTDIGRFAKRPVKLAVLARNTFSNIDAPTVPATTLHRP